MNIFGLFGVIDIVIVVSVVMFAAIGWKQGFLVKIVEMVRGLFGLLASIILARPFSTVLSGWFGDALTLKVYDYLLSRSAIFATSFTYENRVATVEQAFEGMNLPAFIIEGIANAINIESMQSTLVDTLTPIITNLALLVISFIILFFGSMIVFVILKLLAKVVTKLPVIKQVDQVLGVLFGLVKITAIIFILLFILGLLMTIPAIDGAIGDFVAADMLLNEEGFRLSKWLYDNNLLKQIINVFVTVI
jgi:uncharacterized membrane protein required for colicin V production